jgi:hypothetical protein
MLIAGSLFYSCTESSKSVVVAETEDLGKDNIYRLKLAATYSKPDSLRSAEEKTLIRQLEAVFLGGYEVRNGRLEMVLSETDMKKIGLPKAYYDVVKRDIDDVNAYLDTVSSEQRKIMENALIEGFMKPREEYLARKKSQRTE